MDSSSDQGNYAYDQEDRSTHQSDEGDVALLKTKYKEGTSKVYHDFYKTKMCNLYLLNICKKGKDCPFAHDDDEIREKPNLYKTKLCPSFLQSGYCKNGENCSFAHGESELRSTPDLFKTAICNLWTQGKCNSGETCRFAHGYDDLRPAPSHHKFKKNNYNKAFHNNEQAQPRDQGHQHQHQHQHQQHQPHHAQYTQPQPAYTHQAPYNPNMNMPYNQNVGYNQFYPQQPYPPNSFSFPMYPMGMQPTFQDPNMMGNFYYQNQGPQYQGHKK